MTPQETLISILTKIHEMAVVNNKLLEQLVKLMEDSKKHSSDTK